jgi:hypothetical protein
MSGLCESGTLVGQSVNINQLARQCNWLLLA